MTTTDAEASDRADEIVAALFHEPAGRRDPYPLYHQLRTVAPVHYSERLHTWLLTRYEDCRAVLRDPRFEKRFAEMLDRAAPSWRKRSSTSAISRMMLMADPPAHARLRRRVARSFTPRRIAELRPAIEETVREILDDLDASGGGELMERLAFQLPIRVIGELLGIPRADQASFREPVLAMTRCLEVPVTRDELDAADQGHDVVAAYLAELIEHRRTEPGNDLLSALVTDDGTDPLTDQELVDMTLLLLVAGFETTTNLIGNAILTFDEQPDQWALLRAEPALAEHLAMELLRHDTSVQFASRVATEDVEIDGHVIPAGSNVFLMLGAANRDPAVFANPDWLDLRRGEVQPLAFGGGIHYCVGAALASAELEILFTEMTLRYPTFDLVGDRPEHRDRLAFRGVAEIAVDLRDRATTPATPIRPFGDDAAWRAEYRDRLEQSGAVVEEGELAARVAQLEASEFFSSWTSQELRDLASTSYALAFEPGERLVVQGDPAPDAFLLVEGDVVVDVDGAPVENLGPDRLVGERGILTGTARAATVTAATRVQALVLSADRLRRVLESNDAAAEEMRSTLAAYSRA